MTDYIKRKDAVRAMAKYMMDTALIDNPEASDRIEEWEGSIAAPVMSTVKAADVVAVVRCKDCKHGIDAVRGGYKHRLNLIDCNRIDYEHPYIMRSNDFCSWGERAKE